MGARDVANDLIDEAIDMAFSYSATFSMIIKPAKITLARLIASVLAALVVVCIGLLNSAHAQTTLIFSTLALPSDAHAKGLQIFKDHAEASGQFTIKLFDSGRLFTKEGAIANLKRGRGAVDLTYVSPAELADEIPYLSMFSAAYLFDDYDHMRSTFDSELAQSLFDDIAEQTQLRPLAAFYLGTRQLNLRDIGRTVTTPADLAGVKLRMPNSKSWLFMGKALGANPTPLAFSEVYLGLKTGTIDGQDNPLPTNRNAKFHEVTTSIVLTDHYINPIFPVISEQRWQRLSAEQRQILINAMIKTQQFVDRENLQAEKQLVTFFQQAGLKIVVPDKAAFQSYAQRQYLDTPEFSQTWDQTLYQQVRQLAKQP